VVCRSVCHTSETCKTAEPIEMPFALRTRVGLGNHVLDGGPDPRMGTRSYYGKWHAVQNRLNRSICRLGYRLRGPEEEQFQSYSPGCANVLSWEGILAQPGEYDWTVRLERRCGPCEMAACCPCHLCGWSVSRWDSGDMTSSSHDMTSPCHDAVTDVAPPSSTDSTRRHDDGNSPASPPDDDDV